MRDGEVGCWQHKSSRLGGPGGSRRGSEGTAQDRLGLLQGPQQGSREKEVKGWAPERWAGERVEVKEGMGFGIYYLSHMSFDVIQAEGHALVCTAPFGVLLALSTSAQFVFNHLGPGLGVVWAGGTLSQSHSPRAHLCPASTSLPHRHSRRAPAQ